MNYIFIDYETKSFCDLKKHGAWVYSEHKTTDIICMAFRINEGDIKVWFPHEKLPEIFYAKDTMFVARNALFEIAITTNVGLKKYGFPASMADTNNYICTRNMCLSVGMPGSLEMSAIILGMQEKKLDTGAKLIQKYSKPAKKKDGTLYFREWENNDFNDMVEYCKQDVLTDSEIFFKLHNISDISIERGTVKLDFLQNIKGLNIDIEGLKKVKAQLDIDRIEGEKEMENLGVNVRSPKQLIEEFAKYDIKLPNTQAATLQQVKSTITEPRLLKLIQLRERLGKASIKKYDALLNKVSKDGKLRYFLKYYGAGTGRYSSTGVQLHNMKKTKTKPETIETLIEDIKNSDDIIKDAQRIFPGLIVAGKNNTFIMGDFSAIEARVLAFIAGQDDLVYKFSKGIDPYIGMASTILNKPEDQISEDERALGKAVILGAGYQMGANTFHTTCLSWGVNIHKQLAEKSIKLYRQKNPKIVQFWYAIQKAFIQAFYSKNKIFRVGKYIKIVSPGSYVQIQLPSGRSLYYHKVKIRNSRITYPKYGKNEIETDLYGGKLTENVVQAVARDLLVCCMLECRKQNIPPVFHTHDEIVCEVPEELEKMAGGLFKDIMNTPPEWFEGFPLATEIEICKRYHK